MKLKAVRLRPLIITLAAIACLSCRSHVDQKDMSIRVPGATLAGTLFNVEGTGKPKPTVLVLHGSGPDGRTNQYYHLLTDTFARAGYATFIYDKRGSGSSSGNMMAVPFQRLIDDAVAVAEHLKRQPEIDPKQIVIWGGSEGGSIAPEVAVRAKARAVIAQSASGVPFWRQNRFQNIRELRSRGLTEAAVAKEMKVHEAAMHYARTGEGWDKFAALRDDGSQLRITNRQDDVWWRWYGTKLDYEPTPWLRQLAVPILAIWGGDDNLVPVVDSRRAFEVALKDHSVIEFQVFDGADHSLTKNGQPVQFDIFVRCLTAFLLPRESASP